MANSSSFIRRLNLLKQIPIFEKLNWFDLQKIARKVIVVEYKKGDVISKEGNPPDFLFCLVSGRLQAYTDVPGGGKENIEFIHRGMHFGVISVLTDENHSMTFEAINDSVVLKIPKDDFHAILKSIPHLGIQLSEDLSRRVRRKVKGGKSVFESTVISIYSPVKGAGSSTYAANLALSLEKETGKKIVYINISSKGNAGAKENTPQDEAAPKWKKPAADLAGIVGDHGKIMGSVIKDDLKIDLLNVLFDPEDDSLKNAIGSFVSAFFEDYHYVVVDLPNEMDEVVLEALTQSDVVHLITANRKRDLESTRRVLDRLETKLRGRFREEKIRVIVQAFQSKGYVSSEEINKQIDYGVYTVLPNIHQKDLSDRIDAQSLIFLRCHHHSEYAKAVTRIARQIGGVSIGLALGGGAALGLSHIGVLRVLEQEEIPIDMVVGSSMGAVIGGLWAIGNSSEQIAGIARGFTLLSKLKLLDPPIFPISGLLRGQGMRRWLKKQFGTKTFYNVRIPLKVVACDLGKRQDLIIDSGLIAEAAFKSAAIPGIIRPVQENDRLIIDGGILNPLPADVLAECGIKKIIAVNVLQSPEDVLQGAELIRAQLKEEEKIPFRRAPWHFIKFRIGKALLKVFNPNISDIIVQTLQASEYVISEQNAQQADVLIHPDLVGFKWYQIDRIDELIRRGEEATRKLLPEIKKLIEN
jgi:NTE family protein